ncbi:hypothetical protein LTS01_025790, partial [Friedmanniomyces endolithicus]
GSISKRKGRKFPKNKENTKEWQKLQDLDLMCEQFRRQFKRLEAKVQGLEEKLARLEGEEKDKEKE